MTPAIEQLVHETIELTGAEKPALLEDDAPVLSDDALSADDDDGFYMVGLIGGKDVGKSALVNALVGKAITQVTSHGAGTEIAIAYVHGSQEAALRELLDREVAGQYRVVIHDQSNLRRQVLMDLPDIDSRYAAHLQVTRAMLRHMLYPVWVSSVEKYADQQPQQMLARVAEGNTPGNFVFCLTKADQLTGMVAAGKEFQAGASAIQDDAQARQPTTRWETPANAGQDIPAQGIRAQGELKELCDDYACRVQRTLSLDQPPAVFLVSSRAADQFDMAALRELLCRQKADQVVRESKQLATARQDGALLKWLDSQQLAGKAQRLEALQRDAEELIATRVGRPLLERVIPGILDDPGTRMAMADEILQERIAYWPVVNLVHTLLQPLFLLIRSAVSRNAVLLQSSDSLVDACVKESGESFAGLVQSAFGQLRQQQPIVATLFGQNKLWESMPSELAAGTLHRGLADTVQRQRRAAREFMSGGRAALGAPIRWLLTVGALLWFPFIQPVLSMALGDPDPHAWAWRRVTALIVNVLGANYLLRSATFLILYYATLWLALRWNTQHRVQRLFARWRADDFPDESVNLTTQALRWLDELSAPIRTARQRMESLAQRVTDLRKSTRAA